MAILGLGQALAWAMASASAAPPPDPEANRRPDPPASPVRRYDPDASTCQPENLLRGYRSQLAQFADQPPAVLAQLQQLQRERAVGSLNRCIQRGLLSREQARKLAASMGIERDGSSSPGAGAPQSSPSQRP